MKVYLDTSAVAKLLVSEPESSAVASYLDDLSVASPPLSSALLETELRRLAVRFSISQSAVSAVLDRIDLVLPDRSLFRDAGLLPEPILRSLDAVHLATALRVDADAVLTYDGRLQASARAVGMEVVAPS